MLEDKSKWRGSFKYIENLHLGIPGAERDAKIEVWSSSHFPWLYHFSKTTIHHSLVGLCRPSFSAICLRNTTCITRTSTWWGSYVLIVTSGWKISKVSFQCIWVSFVNLDSLNFSPFWINSSLSKMSNSTLLLVSLKAVICHLNFHHFMQVA